MPTTIPASPFYRQDALSETDITILTKHDGARAEIQLYVHDLVTPLDIIDDQYGYRIHFPGRGKPSIFNTLDLLIKGFRKEYNAQLERLRHWERRYILLEQDIDRWGRNISDVAYTLLDASLTEAMNRYAATATNLRAFGVRPSQVSPYRTLDLSPELFRMRVRRGDIQRVRLYYRGVDIDELFFSKGDATHIMHSNSKRKTTHDVAFSASIDTFIETFVSRVSDARTEALAQIDGYYRVAPNDLDLLDAVYAANETFMARRAERNAKARERARQKKEAHHARKKDT